MALEPGQTQKTDDWTIMDDNYVWRPPEEPLQWGGSVEQEVYVEETIKLNAIIE